MPTNDERREVAETLRRLTASEYDGEFFDCGEVEAALGLVTDDGSWYEAAGVRRLADLIEPEPERTCRIYDTDHGFEDSIRCDACQMTFRRPWQPFKFCPNCGAKVTGVEE